MALQVGELYGLLELDTGPFESGLSGVRGSLSGLGSLAGTVAAGIGAALGGAFLAAGAAGVKANSDTEQFMATMEVLTGSTEKARIEMEKLKEFAATTPFSMEDLKQGELTMRAVGVSTEKWRETIGDTAAAFQSTGKSYQDVVDAIADAQTGELERLKEFGVTKNMIVDYANKEMKKNNIVNAKGQITDQETFNEAIKGLLESRYKGMMDKQSKTLAGMTSTFKDFMSQGLEVMSKPIFDVLKSGMEKLLPAVQRLQESGTFERIGQSVADFVDAVMNGFAKIEPILSGAGETFKTIFNTISNAIAYVRPQIDLLSHFWTINFNRISAIVQDVMGYIAPLIRQTIGMVVSWWKQNGTELLINAQIVFNGILKVIQFVMPLVKGIIKYIFDAIKNIIGGALDFIGGMIKIFAGIFQGDFSKMWEGVKQAFSGAIRLIWGLMSLNFVRGILTLVKGLGKGAIGGIKSMWEKIVGFFNSFIVKAQALVMNMVRGIIQKFVGMVNQARTIFSMLRQFGEGIFKALWNTLRSVATNIWHSVRNAFTNMYTSLQNTTRNIWNAVKNTFSKIKTAITNPIETAKNGVKKAVDAIKGFFTGMKLSLPKIKMPKFVIKNWSSNPKDWIKNMPSLGIDWYAKGGIFNGPTIAGIGEAGPEAVVPLAGRRMRPFAQEIARQMGGAGGVGEIYLNAKLVLPDGRVIAEIAEPHIAEIQDMNTKKNMRGWGVYR